MTNSTCPPVPAGFEMAGVHCGIKTDPAKPDLAVIRPLQPCVAAGVYTQNRIVAAPVVLDQQRTPTDACTGVVVNSGNANACTGPAGMEHAIRMCQSVGESADVDGDCVLVMSTGIIGHQLPMENVLNGIRESCGRLASDESAFLDTAHAFMTTDLVPKYFGTVCQTSQGPVQLSGIAKGSGMIAPNMATMLATIMTDTRLTPADAQQLLASATESTFNAITVDGHVSTNDTNLLLASGAAHENVLTGDDLVAFGKALELVCRELAIKIADDGEGASHLVEVQVTGADSDVDAKTIGMAIANSPLVKTAITGADPNWGRIVSAAGYAGVAFDGDGVVLQINGVKVFAQGVPAVFDAAQLSQSMRDERRVVVQISVGSGAGQATCWTCDLTTEYVHINADYST